MRVLVFTPLGEGGEGGVDRMMDGLREELMHQNPEGVHVDFITPGPIGIMARRIHWMPVKSNNFWYHAYI